MVGRIDSNDYTIVYYTILFKEEEECKDHTGKSYGAFIIIDSTEHHSFCNNYIYYTKLCYHSISVKHKDPR
jgi:hypothetical protein